MPEETSPAEPPAPPAPAETPPVEETPPPPPEELGDGGKKALDAERALRKEAEKAAKAAQAELDKLRTDQLPDTEKAIKEAADNARAATLAEVNAKLFAAKLEALTASNPAAQELLADAEVAVRLLSLDEIPVTSDGDIDTEAISAAVASFIEAKPYLAGATPPGETPPAPLDLGQGARGTPPPQRQLNRSDLAGLTPEQIEQARQDGLLVDLLAGKS